MQTVGDYLNLFFAIPYFIMAIVGPISIWNLLEAFTISFKCILSVWFCSTILKFKKAYL